MKVLLNLLGWEREVEVSMETLYHGRIYIAWRDIGWSSTFFTEDITSCNYRKLLFYFNGKYKNNLPVFNYVED